MTILWMFSNAYEHAGPQHTKVTQDRPSLISVPIQYALKIDSLKVKKEPRLATVRAETEVNRIIL